MRKRSSKKQLAIKREALSMRERSRWMLICGVVIGLIFLGTGILIYQYRSPIQNYIINCASTLRKNSLKNWQKQIANKEINPPIEFKFYNTLPKQKVREVLSKEKFVEAQKSHQQNQNKPNSSSSDIHAYVLQAGVFRHEAFAKAFQLKLEHSGYKSFIIEAHSAKKPLYKVQIGPCSDQNTAKQMQHNLLKQHIHSIIFKYTP